MARYIAFLRGINVGGHKVKMDELRGLFESLDLDNVATFIASGNVIFDSNAAAGPLQKRIENHLREALGYDVPTFLRTDAELARIAEQPFPDLEGGGTSYVAFLDRRPPAPARRAVTASSNDVDHLVVHNREIYWHIRGGLMDSTLGTTGLEKALGSVPTTLRNVNTVRRLAAKYPPA
jgi:uncharacterized protein (DUF1697 family)